MGTVLTRREKILGILFLLVAIIALVSLAMLAQERGWFASQRIYRVRFAQGHNIKEGDPVKILTTEVGKVSGIEIFNRMGMILVEITIRVHPENADLIRQDSVATVVHPAQGGGAYLEITPGSPEYPPIEEYGIIPSKGVKTL